MHLRANNEAHTQTWMAEKNASVIRPDNLELTKVTKKVDKRRQRRKEME